MSSLLCRSPNSRELKVGNKDSTSSPASEVTEVCFDRMTCKKAIVPGDHASTETEELWGERESI